jgi:hypothetical protein
MFMFFITMICAIGHLPSMIELAQPKTYSLRIEYGDGGQVTVIANDGQRISFSLPDKANAAYYNPQDLKNPQKVGITHPNFKGVLFLTRDNRSRGFKWRLTAIGTMPDGELKSFWMSVDSAILQEEINALPRKR